VLTGRFVAAAVSATRADGPVRRYAADLVVPREIRAQCALLKAIALRYVMRRPGAEHRYERQREVLTKLVEALAARRRTGSDPVFDSLWKEAPDVLGRPPTRPHPRRRRLGRTPPRRRLPARPHGGGAGGRRSSDDQAAVPMTR